MPVPIASIRELRLNQPPTDGYASARWITVVYTVNNSQWKVLHMTALTDDAYDLWVQTLTRLVSETSDRLVAQVTPADPDLMWIRQLWPAGAKVVDFNTAAGLCGGLGMIIPAEIAEKYNVRRRKLCQVTPLTDSNNHSIWPLSGNSSRRHRVGPSSPRSTTT